jgi:hypothetical protein
VARFMHKELVSTAARSSRDYPPSSAWWLREELTTQGHMPESEELREVTAARAREPVKRGKERARECGCPVGPTCRRRR